MSDIPQFPYSLLWEERQLVSVANLTRQDGLNFFAVVPKVGIKTSTAHTRSRARTKHSPTCERGASRAPLSWCPKGKPGKPTRRRGALAGDRPHIARNPSASAIHAPP